ncbi:MAG: aminotransferase class V-fold PLP-dependent enzyme, partial [Acidimicrobiales bacterium]
MDLDVDFCRSNFPAFAQPSLDGRSFFENAGGSFPCQQTIDALTRYYTETKVQPFGPFELSQRAGEAMDASRQRWAEALGVATAEVQFGPSTSANTYVLATAYADALNAGDRVIVTNQDHEANTGAIRRAATKAGAEVVEWRVDPTTGLLDVERLAALLTPNSRLLTVPHCSNIVGQENDVATIVGLAHEVGARVIVDAVSFAPHTLADVAVLDADIYLFSLYKTYSVHQGLMVTRNGVLDELPNQGHYFNEGS